jgi:hypothetical protein
MSAEEVANAFVQHFYQTFDNGVDGLAGLFVSISYAGDDGFVVALLIACSPYYLIAPTKR